MSIEKHKAFLGSLEGDKGLTDEMHGWRFDAPLNEISELPDRELANVIGGITLTFYDYVIERCRRAESRQIPDLKEKVKAFGIACMEAENARFDGIDGLILRGSFREICAPEVKP